MAPAASQQLGRKTLLVHTPILTSALLGRAYHQRRPVLAQNHRPDFLKAFITSTPFDLAMMIPTSWCFCSCDVRLAPLLVGVDILTNTPRNTPGPPPETNPLPRVTVQLPSSMNATSSSVSLKPYPVSIIRTNLLDVQVLDDFNRRNTAGRECLCRSVRGPGAPDHAYSPRQREGYKAGALENGLKTAPRRVRRHFDADFIPAPDFLRRSIPYSRTKRLEWCKRAGHI